MGSHMQQDMVTSWAPRRPSAPSPVLDTVVQVRNFDPQNGDGFTFDTTVNSVEVSRPAGRLLADTQHWLCAPLKGPLGTACGK